MKKVLLLMFLIVLFEGCKKNNAVGEDTNTGGDTAVSTEKGTPVGNLVSAQIDQSGGSITSADGLVEIVFPAGALKNATSISIQPVTNFCPDSLLTAYRFLPEGLTFDKKPTLTIHYPDSVLQGTYADLLGIAFQDSTGVWNAMTRTKIDSVNKKLSVEIPHFSDWSLFTYMCIRPGSAKVKINKTQELVVGLLKMPFDTSLLATSLAALKTTKFTNWSINGITGGNNEIGNIVPETSNGQYALFGAPAEVPTPSTVAASVEVPAGSGKRLLVSNITIYDVGYSVKMTYDEQVSLGDVYAMHDEASYIVNLKKNGGEVTDIKNQEATFTLITRVSKVCTSKVDPCDGPINITNPIGVSISSSNMITVTFPPTVQSTYSGIITCNDTPVSTILELAQLNGSVTFAKTNAVQVKLVTPHGVTITYTITPLNN
ncbi:MAG: hypothetical protein QM802_00790 [Agriterribacter sp.]